MENNRLLAQLKKRDYFGALGTDRKLFLKCGLQVCDMNFTELTEYSFKVTASVKTAMSIWFPQQEETYQTSK